MVRRPLPIRQPVGWPYVPRAMIWASAREPLRRRMELVLLLLLDLSVRWPGGTPGAPPRHMQTSRSPSTNREGLPWWQACKQEAKSPCLTVDLCVLVMRCRFVVFK
jgi:hypothetical protein